MEPERDEVYERIPWETLEKKGGDRQWLVYAIAGAVTLGALAYSFTRNQPAPAPAAIPPVVSTIPATTIAPSIDAPPSTVPAPIVVAEADLYAVDPERLIDRAVAHAEWFALEFAAVDGSEESRGALSSLMPEGIPLPEAPGGTQVFVDWVNALEVTQTGPTGFEVAVLVRSLVSTGDEGFTRRPPEVLVVPVAIDEDGLASITGPPRISSPSDGPRSSMSLREVPPDAAAVVSDGEILGGMQRIDGGWDVVVVVEDDFGVRRPVTVTG